MIQIRPDPARLCMPGKFPLHLNGLIDHRTGKTHGGCSTHARKGSRIHIPLLDDSLNRRHNDLFVCLCFLLSDHFCNAVASSDKRNDCPINLGKLRCNAVASSDKRNDCPINLGKLRTQRGKIFLTQDSHLVHKDQPVQTQSSLPPLLHRGWQYRDHGGPAPPARHQYRSAG